MTCSTCKHALPLKPEARYPDGYPGVHCAFGPMGDGAHVAVMVMAMLATCRFNPSRYTP